MIRRRLSVGIVMALGLQAAACGKPSGDEAVKASQKLADEICACKDLDCVKAAGERGVHELKKFEGVKHDEKQDQAMAEAGKRASECTKKLQPPPPAPPPEAPPAPPAAPAGADAGPTPPPPAPPK